MFFRVLSILSVEGCPFVYLPYILDGCTFLMFVVVRNRLPVTTVDGLRGYGRDRYECMRIKKS